MDEDFGLSEILAHLQIEAICRFTVDQKISRKNTIDLQWKMRANYNARLCVSGRKSQAQEQWQAMEKTMRRAIGTVGKSGRVHAACRTSVSPCRLRKCERPAAVAGVRALFWPFNFRQPRRAIVALIRD